MFNQPTEQSQPYFDLIAQALRQRGLRDDDYDRHPVHRQSNYVVRMCEALHKQIGRDSVSLEQVLRVEQSASGHVDYHAKCALYCAELAAGIYPN